MGASKARWGKGATISVGGSAVGEILSIGGVEVSRDTADVSNHDSDGDFKEYIPTFRDGGEVAITGNYVQGDVGQLALGTAAASGAASAIVITFPKLSTESAAAKWSFNAIVTKYKPVDEAGTADQLKFGATLKITGAPTFTDATVA